MPKNSVWNSHLFGCFSTSGEKAKYSKAMMKQSSRLSFTDVSDIEDISISFGCSLYAFNMNELKEITDNFSKNNFLGEGGFGPVYKGFMEEKLKPSIQAQTVAVKLLDLEGSQGHREWMSEVILLGQLRHPHLVKLIGYCWEKQQRVLVYEYMEGGSLENHLFKSTSTPSSPSQNDDASSACLPWLMRLKIAVGAAKGLAFLHGVDKPVIYRDFKASNILLQSTTCR